MKVLVIEDDRKISTLLFSGLSEAGYEVELLADGELGLQASLTKRYDVIVLDLLLPKIDGLTLLTQIKQHNPNQPILILSAKQSVDDRLVGLKNGADDYLGKPFSFQEFLARVQVLHRRTPSRQVANQLKFEDILLDRTSRQVSRGRSNIELHIKEFMLLEFFLENPTKALTKAQILEKVWGYEFDPQTNVVDVLVCRLRNKIDKDFDHKLIHTIRGVGYVLRKS